MTAAAGPPSAADVLDCLSCGATIEECDKTCRESGLERSCCGRCKLTATHTPAAHAAVAARRGQPVADFHRYRPLVHLHLSQQRRDLSLYAAGSSKVTRVRPAMVSAHEGAGHAQLNHADAVHLVDALAAATGHYPTTLDAQRAHTDELADELAARRRNGDDLAALAHARHLGRTLAGITEALFQLGDDFLGDRTTAEMFAELVGMVDAMRIGPTLTNPRERIAAHRARVLELADQLPPTGEPNG